MVDYIQEFDAVVSSDVCAQLIKKFDYYDFGGGVNVPVVDKFTTDGGRADRKRSKEAKVIYVNPKQLMETDIEFAELIEQCIQGMHQCAPIYIRRLGKINIAPIYIRQIDFLKYEQGTGFYGPHVDSGMKSLEHRVISFLLYLNDVEEGGETQFVLQDDIVKPIEGKLVMFPSNFCFVHQSNRTISDAKYILVCFSSFGR